MQPELERFGTCTLDQDGCTTCGDVAVPVRLLKLEGNSAVVEDRLGQRADVLVDFIKDAKHGDILLIHMGIAIGKGGLAEG